MTKIMFIFSALFALAAIGDEIPVGVTRFKLEKPVEENALATRYVLDAFQELVLSCPENHEVKSVSCDAVQRIIGSSFVNNDLAARINNTISQIEVRDGSSVGTCRAKIVRADEVVRLNLSVTCGEKDHIVKR